MNQFKTLKNMKEKIFDDESFYFVKVLDKIKRIKDIEKFTKN